MNNSNYPKYLSMKFKYLFLKFIQNYKNTNQFGGYLLKIKPTQINNPTQKDKETYKKAQEEYLHLKSIMEAAAYAAVKNCIGIESPDCNPPKLEIPNCDDDSITLSIVASMFLSILGDDLHKLIISMLIKKLINCKSNLLKKEDVERIIEYYLKFIEKLNNNLDKISEYASKIFLSSEYSDSKRAAEYKKKLVLGDPRAKLLGIRDDVDLAIINKFFEDNISKITKISFSRFIELLQENCSFQQIIFKFKSELKLDTLFSKYSEDKTPVDLLQLIFIGIFKKDIVIQSFTKKCSIEATLGEPTIKFLEQLPS
jgi:hypothetical protein